MSKRIEKDYFTAGELANIYGISKQTLLYYDKVNLLSPELIAENGYRHYFIQQYLDLEIIINMRALNFSIAEIKDYLENRSKERFIEILKQRKSICEKLINDNIKICEVINNILEETESSLLAPVDKITLTYKKEELLKLTPILDSDSSLDSIIKFAKHTQFNFHNNHLSKKHCGFIIEQNKFNDNEKYYSPHAYFSFVPNTPGHRRILKNTLPQGFYLEINFQGSYYRNAIRIRNKIHAFLESNNLQAIGDVYILPVENHWYFKNTNDYLTKLFLQVGEK